MWIVIYSAKMYLAGIMFSIDEKDEKVSCQGSCILVRKSSFKQFSFITASTITSMDKTLGRPRGEEANQFSV
jgi:hypothetical protein